MTRLFFTGFSRAQESFGGSRRFRPKRYRPAPMLWLFRKELKMFLRDSAQWSQLFLIGALVVVYLYNFKVLPLDRSPIPAEAVANLIAYANIALTGFIVASLSARFVYPSIGSEGGAFGLILTAPISLRRYMFYKYLFYVLPFTALTLILLAASNRLLGIAGPMWWITLVTGLIITWSVVAVALGFGAMFADFKAESQAAALGGFGAVLFLFTAVAFELLTITAAAIPAYRLVRSWRWGLHGSAPIVVQTSGVFLLILLLGCLVSLVSLRRGMEKLGENFR
jgi:ABC-2 type transport system permease protein